MVEVVYKSLTALHPLELRYEYFNNNILNTETVGYQEGYSFYKVTGLTNFTDTSINKGSCFVLTTGINLGSFFSQPETISIGEIPGTFKLQSRNSTIIFAKYNSSSNTITFDSLEGDNFFITPIKNSTREIEIRVGDLNLQIDSTYPYTARLGESIVVEEEKYRQRFYYTYINGFIGFKVITNEGSRFLSFGVDNILRGVGVILNESRINDYYFKCINVTSNNLSYDFIPANKWVTYFLDFPNQENNSDVSLNKEFTNNTVNYLVDFPIEQAIKTGRATINIANLKTGFTPAGGPSPVDNSYTETIQTTN